MNRDDLDTLEQEQETVTECELIDAAQCLVEEFGYTEGEIFKILESLFA